MLSLSPYRLTLVFLFGAALAVGTAWAFELIGGYAPCALCLVQREPYYLSLILAAALVILWRQLDPLAQRMALLAISGLMIWGAGLGVYQAGAEWNFWQGPTDCSVTGAGATLDASNLLDQLQNTRLVSCTEASFRFLGLSFAGWNVLSSTALAALAALAAVKTR